MNSQYCNITISLSLDTARWLHSEAAKHNLSVSHYVAELIEQERQASNDYDYVVAMVDYLARLTPVLELPDRLPSGVVSPNPIKFRQLKSSPATIISRSMICPTLRNV